MPKQSFTSHSLMHGPSHQLRCALCGEEDRRKLHVEDLGLSVGMCGEDYSFCRACWCAPDLGKKILRLLGFRGAMKIKDENVTTKALP